jgi:hypothetical protein
VGLGARLVKSLRRRAKQAHDGIIAHVGYRIADPAVGRCDDRIRTAPRSPSVDFHNRTTFVIA